MSMLKSEYIILKGKSSLKKGMIIGE